MKEYTLKEIEKMAETASKRGDHLAAAMFYCFYGARKEQHENEFALVLNDFILASEKWKPNDTVSNT